MSGDFTCFPISTSSTRVLDCRSSTRCLHFRHNLVIVSKYGIVIAVANNQELVSFRNSKTQCTSSVIDANAQRKVTAVGLQGEIVSIGLNADECFLGAYVNNQQGCFVYVYDVLTLSVDISGEAFSLTTIRIGNTCSKGLAFEWNPAICDMFAASNDGQTLSVCKIDLSNPSKYSIVGEKRLDTNIHEVSWSPKGKQLVVGDESGKIIQMKPELELVRVTNAPENVVGLKIISLCWLTTTEWLVTYSNEQMSVATTLLMSIKKDKAPSWTPVNLPIHSSLGFTRKLLLDWNLVLLVIPGMSHLFSLSKRKGTEEWSLASLISSMESASTNFITGIAIDLSNAEVCPNGSLPRRLPVVSLLSSDGSMRSYWVAPPSCDYPDCYISLTPVDVSMVRNGIRLLTEGSHYSVDNGAPEWTSNKTPVTLQHTLVTTNSSTSEITLTPATAKHDGRHHITEHENEMSAQVSLYHSVSQSDKNYNVRSLVKDSVNMFMKNWDCFHERSHSFCINLHKSERHIDDIVATLDNVVNVDAIQEIQRMLMELDDEMEDLLYKLKEKRSVINMESGKQGDGIALIVNNSSELERCQYESVIQRYEDFVVRLHATEKMIMDIKKTAVGIKPRWLSNFDPKFEGRLQEGLKNLSRYSCSVRARVVELERKVSHLSSRSRSKAGSLISKESAVCHASWDVPGLVFMHNSLKPIYLQRTAPRNDMRKKLLSILRGKKPEPAIKKIEQLPFDRVRSNDSQRSSFSNFESIEATLAQKTITPVKTKPMVTMRNVSTQAEIASFSTPTVPIIPTCTYEMPPTASAQANVGTATPDYPSTLSSDKKPSDVTIAPISTSTPNIVKSIASLEKSVISDVAVPCSEKTSSEEINKQHVTIISSASERNKTQEPSKVFTPEMVSNNNKVEVEERCESGSIVPPSFLSKATKEVEEKPSFSFGGVALTTSKKSDAHSTANVLSEASGGPTNLANVAVRASPDIKDEEIVTTTTLTNNESNMATSGGESSTGLVTFSFKTLTTAEPGQQDLSKQPFKFDIKGDGITQDVVSSTASNVDADEGMDDDGAIGAISTKSSNIFGRGFMSGIGSTTDANTGKNVFGMGTGNLLKNTLSSNNSTSIFSGGQNKSQMVASDSSSFASAAQKAVQSGSPNQSTLTNTVFGAAPKFGGPPVFGGKPIFGSTPAKPSPPVFGSGAALSSGFSAFSGAKNLFGSVSSGTSSVFGGGVSNLQSSKDTLFGGTQPNKSFSTWR